MEQWQREKKREWIRRQMRKLPQEKLNPTNREKGIVQNTPEAGRKSPTGENIFSTASVCSSARCLGSPST